MRLQSDTVKTLVKFCAVFVGAFAGSLQHTHPVWFASLSALGVALQGLTVSGWTRADVVKTSLKLAGQLAATGAGALQATQPLLASALLAVGAACTASTIPAPGTAAKIGDAERRNSAPAKSLLVLCALLVGSALAQGCGPSLADAAAHLRPPVNAVAAEMDRAATASETVVLEVERVSRAVDAACAPEPTPPWCADARSGLEGVLAGYATIHAGHEGARRAIGAVHDMLDYAEQQ